MHRDIIPKRRRQVDTPTSGKTPEVVYHLHPHQSAAPILETGNTSLVWGARPSVPSPNLLWRTLNALSRHLPQCAVLFLPQLVNSSPSILFPSTLLTYHR